MHRQIGHRRSRRKLQPRLHEGCFFGPGSQRGTLPQEPGRFQRLLHGDQIFPAFPSQPGATPETVTYGYTAGYLLGFATAGALVYGTGYYYPPVVLPGIHPGEAATATAQNEGPLSVPVGSTLIVRSTGKLSLDVTSTGFRAS